MVLELNEAVPWGRNLIEYIRMFSLTPDVVSKRILDCAAGPSSFNCEITNAGGKVVSCDPIYILSKIELESKITEIAVLVEKELTNNAVNSASASLEHERNLNKFRLSAMKTFLSDYEKGKTESRYIYCEFPELNFANDEFDLSLCSHFLFTYSQNLTLQFHIDAIKEMTRVAKEARIFPVFSLDGKQSDFLEPVIDSLTQDNYYVQIQPVNYELIEGSNKVLIVKKR